MKSESPEGSGRDTTTGLSLLLLVCAALFFSGLGSRDLWNPDEPRIAEIAREMSVDGHWIVLHENGRIYAHKPPLTYWLVAWTYELSGGPSAAAAKVPSALATTGSVLLTYLFGVHLFGRRAGLLGALLLATSEQVFFLGGRASIDTILSFFILAALYAFWRFGRDGVRRNGWLMLFFILMGLATMTKGLIGFILPIGVAGAFLLWSRPALWPRVGPVLIGTVLMLAVVLPWGIAADRAGPEGYIHELVIKHHFQRASGLDGYKPHEKSLFDPFYFYMFPALFFPGALFLPGAWLFFRRGERRLSPDLKYLLTWFAIIFIFFSISRSKRELYLLPALPAAALLVGAFLERHLLRGERRMDRRWVTLPVYLLGGLLIGVAVGWPIFLLIQKKLEVPWLSGAVPAVAALIGGMAMVLAARRDDGRRILAATFGSFIALYLLIGLLIFPVFDRGKSLKPFATELKEAVGGQPWVWFWTMEHAVSFHENSTAREFVKEEVVLAKAEGRKPRPAWELLLLAMSDEKSNYLVIRRKHIEEDPEKPGFYRLRKQNLRPPEETPKGAKKKPPIPFPSILRLVVEDRSRAGLALVTADIEVARERLASFRQLWQAGKPGPTAD